MVTFIIFYMHDVVTVITDRTMELIQRRLTQVMQRVFKSMMDDSLLLALGKQYPSHHWKTDKHKCDNECRDRND